MPSQSVTKLNNMKYFKFALLVLIMGCQQPDQSQNQKASSARGKLFIIGGGSRGPALVERMILEAGLDTAGYAVILPMASSEPDSAIFYAKKQFTAKGISNVVGMHFKVNDTVNQSTIDSLEQARLIYISGGDQRRFMQIVAKTTIEEAIKQAHQQGAMIAGTSAGAAVMSQMMITGDEKKHPDYQSTFSSLEFENIIIADGLGLLDNDIIIDQHFVERSRYNRLLTAIIEFPDKIGMGISESTALLVSGDSAEVVGRSQVVKLSNPEGNQKIANGLLGAENLNLSVYLPGDKFKLK